VALSLTRVQQITQKNVLWLVMNGQHAFDNLDSSERISLGGPTGIRAYPTAEANGDDGVTITAELRHQLFDKFQMVGFYDWGHIRLNHETWTGWNASNTAIQNEYELKSWGFGCRWNFMEGYELVGNVAKKINENPGMSDAGKDGDGTHRDVRGWLSIVKVF
jgi:hemolysin activation/secretion protein